MSDPLRQARGYAHRLLRYRPRSRQELAHRLELRGYPADAINTLLNEFTASGALDDRRFALLWARSRALSQRGSRRIAQELQLRGVAQPLIAETLTALSREHDEPAAARAVVERGLARLRREPWQVQWRRLSQQLARRGYATNIIEDVLRQCLQRCDDQS